MLPSVVAIQGGVRNRSRKLWQQDADTASKFELPAGLQEIANKQEKAEALFGTSAFFLLRE